jgi:iron(III) transport system permease protein
VLLVAALCVFLLQRYWVSRRFYVTITGKGAGETPFKQHLARDPQRPALRSALR